MNRSNRYSIVKPAQSLLIAFLLAMCVALVAEHSAARKPNQQVVKKNINDQLEKALTPVTETPISIAPMTKQGDQTPGTYTEVKGGIFDAIFKRAGIEQCKSNPADLVGHDGFLELVDEDNSMVLNPGGTRATFGYFIKVANMVHGKPQQVEYFVLFSYDKIVVKGADGNDKIICATELFLFAPAHYFLEPTQKGISEGKVPGTETFKPSVIGGYAIGSDGQLLEEVPYALAKVANFPKTTDHQNETVKPGTDKGKGCMLCHTDGSDKFPQSTVPYPWAGPPDSFEPLKTNEGSGNQPKDKLKEKTEPTVPNAAPKDDTQQAGSGQSGAPTPTPTPNPTPHPAPRQNTGNRSGYYIDTTTANGLVVTTFETPQGKIKVNLPDDMATGDTISGTVEAEPKGKDDAERAKNQSELNGEVIDIGGQKTKVGDKKISCTIPLTLSGDSKTITLSSNGQPVATSTVPISNTRPPAPTQFTLPTGGQQGRPIQIQGPCNGVQAPEDSVQIGGTVAPVLAESPRQIVVQNTSTTVGPTNIECNENGSKMECPFRNIGIKLSAPKTTLRRGETTTLHVEVTGLQGIKENLQLDLNATGVVQMSGGNEQHVTIPSTQVQADGTVSLDRTLTGTSSGGFGVTGTVRWSDVCKQSAVLK